MKKANKLTALFLTAGMGLGLAFGVTATTCTELCNWAAQVCADESQPFWECAEAQRDCRTCRIP